MIVEFWGILLIVRFVDFYSAVVVGFWGIGVLVVAFGLGGVVIFFGVGEVG